MTDILCLFTDQHPLAVRRRILAPYQVLSERGYQVSCFHSDYSQPLTMAFGHHIVVLQDWLCTEATFPAYERLANETDISLVYDLTRPAFLLNPIVQKMLRLSTVVTVPSETLAKEVRCLRGVTTTVLPSCVDIPYLLYSLHDIEEIEPATCVLGCVGPHDFYLLRDTFERLTPFFENGTMTAICDAEALEQFYGLSCLPYLNAYAECVKTHADFLTRCDIGLCPMEGRRTTEDGIWALEYALHHIPVLASKDSVYEEFLTIYGANELIPLVTTGTWMARIEELIPFSQLLRQTITAPCFEIALLHSSKILATVYLKMLNRFCLTSL